MISTGAAIIASRSTPGHWLRLRGSANSGGSWGDRGDRGETADMPFTLAGRRGRAIVPGYETPIQ